MAKEVDRLICSEIAGMVQHGNIPSLPSLLSYVRFYVDDIIITGDDISGIVQMKRGLRKAFDIKDLSPLRYFLGIDIARSRHGISLSAEKSKKQAVVSRSSVEAEYRAMTQGISEILWLRSLLTELDFSVTNLSYLFCDNKLAIMLSSDSVLHERTKHIEVDIHFIWGKVRSRVITPSFVLSSAQTADMFTNSGLLVMLLPLDCLLLLLIELLLLLNLFRSMVLCWFGPAVPAAGMRMLPCRYCGCALLLPALKLLKDLSVAAGLIILLLLCFSILLTNLSSIGCWSWCIFNSRGYGFMSWILHSGVLVFLLLLSSVSDPALVCCCWLADVAVAVVWFDPESPPALKC
ncbi:hypothetical protein Acr_00g0032440 [Actinidia rufa]|uniref:Reverse transcriptase Ty1/copia-type domain-containing protein n=1 Tax=Actinidia rufa TaxID=165716 RepID=A0A7J0DFF1_9ERIC|nr:hypothetical protein Acr_00g0032440 [Actinidia rufa]